MRKPWRRFVRHVVVVLVAAVALLVLPSRAHAYPWMIRHGYTACGQCHADPSGGGVLTDYGRTIGEVVLRTHYGTPAEDPGKLPEFLFGALPLPESVLLGGDVRSIYRSSKAQGATAADTELLVMQGDLQGHVALDRFRANASVGYAQRGALPASVTHAASGNLISRVHWIGYAPGEAEGQWLVRVGRMNVPFGVRSIEHTLWSHTYNGTNGTRTDINSGQEHGIALAFNKGPIRAEAMAILGNFQISPDIFRERGYSAFAEYAFTTKLAAGVSSLITHANRDVFLQTETIRHAHGVFGRWSPAEPLVFLAEADLTLTSQPSTPTLAAINTVGGVGFFQTDVEPLQGVHLIATGEFQALPTDTKGPSYGGWGSLAWFFAPHADLRLDAIYRIGTPGSAGHATSTTLLAQLHFYL
jgi:hypothetical protein